jgi:hypothetical protein
MSVLLLRLFSFYEWNVSLIAPGPVAGALNAGYFIEFEQPFNEQGSVHEGHIR